MSIEIPATWRPRRYQKALWRYLLDGGLRADVAAHRRWGKDDVALNWTAVAAMSRPGAYWHLLPEASQGRKAIWDAVNPHTGRRRIDEAFPPAIRSKTRDSDMMIVFQNGSTWQVCGSDNYDSLVGAPPVGVVFSEWALAKPDCWTYIRPILAENSGWAVFLWTSDALFLGTYVGSINQPWRFDRVGLHCGLIGPNAAVVVGQTAIWLGPDLQFRRYSLGGAPEIIECPIRAQMAENLASSQGDKIVASSISTFNEVRFDYPDARDGNENSRYIALSLTGGAWYRGVMARTAFVDAGPSDYPLGVDPTGHIYWHELGQSANGGVLSWFLETADTYLDENLTMMCRGLWPDLAEQAGPVFVGLTTRLKPQDQSPRSFGPYTMGVGDAKVDMRAAGRLFKVRFSGNSAPSSMRLGKLSFDLVAAGAR